MADDKTKMDQRDRSGVAGDEDYEVAYFSSRHGISQDEARALIKKHGNNREELEKAVSRRA